MPPLFTYFSEIRGFLTQINTFGTQHIANYSCNAAEGKLRHRMQRKLIKSVKVVKTGPLDKCFRHWPFHLLKEPFSLPLGIQELPRLLYKSKAKTQFKGKDLHWLGYFHSPHGPLPPHLTTTPLPSLCKRVCMFISGLSTGVLEAITALLEQNMTHGSSSVLCPY